MVLGYVATIDVAIKLRIEKNRLNKYTELSNKRPK